MKDENGFRLPVEGVTSLGFESAIEYASGRAEAQRIVRLRLE